MEDIWVLVRSDAVLVDFLRERSHHVFEFLLSGFLFEFMDFVVAE